MKKNSKSKPQSLKPTVLFGYRRRSIVRNEIDMISPERQMKMCDLWVEMQGEDYTIEWYEDVEGHRSGRDEKGRPGWQQLLTQLESDQTSDRMAANIKYKREQLGPHWGPLPFGADRGPEGHLIPTTKTYWFNPISGNALPNPEVDGRDPAPPAPGYELRRFIDALTAVYRAYSAENVSYDTVAATVNEAGWRYYRDANAIPRPFNKEDIRRLVSFWQLYRGDLPIDSLTKIQNPLSSKVGTPLFYPLTCATVSGW